MWMISSVKEGTGCAPVLLSPRFVDKNPDKRISGSRPERNCFWVGETKEEAAVIQARNPNKAGSESNWEIKRIFQVGRQDSDLRLSDLRCSRTHAYFYIHQKQNAQETHEDPAQLFVLDVSRSGTFIDDVRVPGVRDASGTQHLQFDRNDYRFDGAVRALKTPWTRVLDGQIVRFGEESYRLQKVNLVVCFSKFKSSVKKLLSKSLEVLGVQITNDVSLCTHLVMDQVIMTPKLLLALVENKAIVRPEFFKVCLHLSPLIREALPNEKNFLPDNTGPLKDHLNLLVDRNRTGLFKDATLAFVNSKEASMAREVLEKAGATIVIVKRRKDYSLFDPATTFVVVQEKNDNNRSLKPPVRFKSVRLTDVWARILRGESFVVKEPKEKQSTGKPKNENKGGNGCEEYDDGDGRGRADVEIREKKHEEEEGKRCEDCQPNKSRNNKRGEVEGQNGGATATTCSELAENDDELKENGQQPQETAQPHAVPKLLTSEWLSFAKKDEFTPQQQSEERQPQCFEFADLIVRNQEGSNQKQPKREGVPDFKRFRKTVHKRRIDKERPQPTNKRQRTERKKAAHETVCPIKLVAEDKLEGQRKEWFEKAQNDLHQEEETAKRRDAVFEEVESFKPRKRTARPRAPTKRKRTTKEA